MHRGVGIRGTGWDPSDHDRRDHANGRGRGGDGRTSCCPDCRGCVQHVLRAPVSCATTGHPIPLLQPGSTNSSSHFSISCSSSPYPPSRHHLSPQWCRWRCSSHQGCPSCEQLFAGRGSGSRRRDASGSMGRSNKRWSARRGGWWRRSWCTTRGCWRALYWGDAVINPAGSLQEWQCYCLREHKNDRGQRMRRKWAAEASRFKVDQSEKVGDGIKCTQQHHPRKHSISTLSAFTIVSECKHLDSRIALTSETP